MQFRFTRVLALVAALGLATAGCGKYSISNIRSLKAFKDAVELYEKADYKDAADGFDAAIHFNPDFGFSYFYLGNSYDKMYKPAKKGDPDNDANLSKAVDNYRLAIDKLADSPEPQAPQFRKLAYEYLVAAYGTDKLNDFAKAEAAAKELISVEPDEPGNYQALARLYEDQGRMDDAETMFRKATEVKPNEPGGYVLLASFYNRQGDFDKTMEAFQKRAQMEPNNPEAWHTMATYYFDKASRDKRLTPAQEKTYIQSGIDAADKALALNPNYYEAVTYKSLLLALAANVEKDPAKQKDYLKQADSLRQQALDLQKKQESDKAAAGAQKK